MGRMCEAGTRLSQRSKACCDGCPRRRNALTRRKRLFSHPRSSAQRHGIPMYQSSAVMQFFVLCLVCLPLLSNSLLHGRQQVTRSRRILDKHVSDKIVPTQGRKSEILSLAASFARNFESHGDDFSTISKLEVDVLLHEAQDMQQSALVLVKRNQLKKAYELLEKAVERLGAVHHDESVRLAYSEAVEGIVQAVCTKGFAMPPKYDHVVQAVFALQLQLSSSDKLSEPYNTVPKRTLARALHALTSINEVQGRKAQISVASNESATVATKLSFRILQRLITGVGVRPGKDNRVHEREINQVLNVFCNLGNLDMAHRIMALQQRTPDAPPLSAVAYSILLKGYGRQKDLDQVEQVLRHATKNKIQPDVVLLNTLIDAYINCNTLAKAQNVFDAMKSQSSAIFPECYLPEPNRRTYNTMLKGYANAGAYDEAIKLSNELSTFQNWDAVTANTLVRAAVIANDFDAAERLLAKHTIHPSDRSPDVRSHPNVEAYTELLNAYAKAGDMRKATSVLQAMKKRRVSPNTITYTCMVAGLGRSGKVEKAKKMLEFMAQAGHAPSTITYNALISSLVEGSRSEDSSTATGTTSNFQIDAAVDHSLLLLRDMMNCRIRPNAVTAMLLVEAMGRCEPPRTEAATLLVDMLEKKKRIPVADVRVMTALIRSCGFGGDIERAVQYFRRLKAPDLIAINAFMDTCYRCDRDSMVSDTFHHYFSQKEKTSSLSPDVITYSILFSSMLKTRDLSSLREIQTLYSEMKRKWKICPDTNMIDTVLKSAILIARKSALTQKDISFIARVIRDADRLTWQEGQLERRKGAVRAILGDRLRDAFLNDPQRLLQTEDDKLFKKKGWNKVDSGFRLWGQVSLDESAAELGGRESSADEFLESHGWNNVDSGFRIL